jgi:GNAT superfamily N-acetyltransferase
MAARLTLRVLPPAPRYGAPFDANAAGFNEGWWISRWDEAGGADADAIMLSVDGDEVARAMVRHDAPESAHVGLDLLTDPLELARIEVREQHRGRGLGRGAVRAIAHHYVGRDLWVHGDEAAFYEKTGWTRYERADGDTSLVPFFVLHA